MQQRTGTVVERDLARALQVLIEHRIRNEQIPSLFARVLSTKECCPQFATQKLVELFHFHACNPGLFLNQIIINSINIGLEFYDNPDAAPFIRTSLRLYLGAYGNARLLGGLDWLRIRSFLDHDAPKELVDVEIDLTRHMYHRNRCPLPEKARSSAIRMHTALRELVVKNQQPYTTPGF